MYRPADNTATIVHRSDFFAHDHALSMTRWALDRSTSPLVVLDLSRVVDTTTAALAALILLRRTLMGRGRDLHLVGLSGRPLQLYQVNRLDTVLPRADLAAEGSLRLVCDSDESSDPVWLEEECRAAA